MEGNGQIKVDKNYLEYLIDFNAKKLVGKVCKRFEIIGGSDLLKKEVKELLYEGLRDLRDEIHAHGYGLDITVFEFKNKGKNPSITK